MNLMTRREFLKTLNDFFSVAQYENEIFFILMIPVLLVFIALISNYLGRSSVRPLLSSVSKKDFELIETIRLQKGIEEFDRDFLIEIALTYQINPTYILIDSAIYNQAVSAFKASVKESGESPVNNERCLLLEKLREKIFK